MAETASYDTIKELILAEKDEAWLQQAIKKHETAFPGEMDPALRLWMIGRAAGIEVPEIRAEQAREYKHLDLGEFSVERCKEEMEKDQDEREMYSVEGIVMNLVFDETTPFEEGKAPKSRVKFQLRDATGKAPVSGWGDQTVALVTEARVKDGDYVRIPMANMFGRFMDKAETRFWHTLTIPPFGSVEKAKDKSWRDVYLSPNDDAVQDKSPIAIEGVVTVLDPRDQDSCSVCRRWIKKDKPTEHSRCGDYEVVNQRSFSGTISQLNASIYKFGVGHWMQEPDFPVGTGLVRLFGTWNAKYRTLDVERWESVNANSVTLQNPKPITATKAAPPKPATKAAPKPTPAPEPEATEEAAEASEVDATEAYEAAALRGLPDPVPANRGELDAMDFRSLQGLAKALGVNAKQKQPVLTQQVHDAILKRVGGEAVEEEPEAAPAPAPAPKPAPKAPPKAAPAPAPSKAPAATGSVTAIREGVLGLLREMGPLSMDDLMNGAAEALGAEASKIKFAIGMLKTSGLVKEANGVLTAEAAEEVEEEEAPTPAPKPAPKPASTPAPKPAPAAKPAPSAAPKPTPKPTPPPVSATSEEDIPERFMTHIEEYVRDFEGQNRTNIVINNGISDGVVEVSEEEIKTYGDKEAAMREKMHVYLEQLVQEGRLAWVGEWRKDGDRRIPPREVEWVE